MHPVVFAAFERICRTRGACGAVLEVGAVPTPDTLLCLPALAAASERVGLDLDGPHDCDGFEIVRGNGNSMPFSDHRFDTIVCNSMLEHDPRFWLTLAEMRRVARPGALIVIGVPAFARRPLPFVQRAQHLVTVPIIGRLIEARLASTRVLHVHDYPGDFYRFSEEAMREVLLDGLGSLVIETVLDPPRLIGSGFRPSSA